MDLWQWRRGVFNYIDVEGVISAFFTFLILEVDPFLHLCIKWNTVKSASVLAAGGQISPYHGGRIGILYTVPSCATVDAS